MCSYSQLDPSLQPKSNILQTRIFPTPQLLTLRYSDYQLDLFYCNCPHRCALLQKRLWITPLSIFFARL